MPDSSPAGPATGPATGTAVAWQLADFVSRARPTDLPVEVRREALRSLVNWLGCAIGGVRHELVAAADKALLPFSGPGEATVIGRGRKADLLTASLLNGVSSSAYAFDDTHADMVLHPAGPIAAALLALAERQRIAGPDFLLAFVLGFEIESRLARAMSVAPAACDVGWFLTGLTGGVGAAYAVGKLLGLDAAGLVSASGIAACGGAGFRALHGSMCSALIPAQAGQTGLRAGLMAAAGFTGSKGHIDGPRGFLELYADTPDAGALTRGLGENWEVMANTYKPYPCGIVIHPIIDACLSLRSEPGFALEKVERVAIRANPVAVTLAGPRRHPRDDLEAKVSIHHWVAAVLADGKAGIQQGSKVRIADPAIAPLRERVEVTSDPTVAGDAAVVEIALAGLGTRRCHIPHGIGSRDNPMSDADISTKFLNLADGILAPDTAAHLLAQSWALETLADTGDLGRGAAGGN